MNSLLSVAMFLFTVHTAASQCSSGNLRLTPGPSTGTLQICKNNEWNNVCSTDWGNLDAAVACRQLGYDGGYTQSTSSHVPGATTDPVEYHCTGREATLQACNSRTLSSCTRGVSLACVHANTTDPCTSGDIRLWGGETEREGNIELCNGRGVWSAVYDSNWDSSDATVACRQLTYTNSIPIVYSNSAFGERVQPAEYGGLNCRDSEASLQDCSIDGTFVQTWSKLFFSNQDDYAGVKCIERRESVCTHGDVRLVCGFAENNGLAELCIHGVWIGVCASHREIEEDVHASMICRQLGYTRYTTISNQGFFQSTGNNKSVGYISFICRPRLDSSVLIDCVREDRLYYIGSCTPLGVLCCQNDIASCYITSPPTTESPTTVTTQPTMVSPTTVVTPTRTVTSAKETCTMETTPTTATGSDDDSTEGFSLYFGEAATLLIESLSRDLRGVEEDIKSRVANGISEECNCLFGIADIRDGFFSFGVYLKYSGKISSMENHSAANLVLMLKTSLDKDPLIYFRTADVYLEVKTL